MIKVAQSSHFIMTRSNACLQSTKQSYIWNVFPFSNIALDSTAMQFPNKMTKSGAREWRNGKTKQLGNSAWDGSWVKSGDLPAYTRHVLAQDLGLTEGWGYIVTTGPC